MQFGGGCYIPLMEMTQRLTANIRGGFALAFGKLLIGISITAAGAWAYFAAWDVHHAQIYGRCERKTGIAPFSRLVAQVMDQEPYRSAQRVFWIMDNGSSHRGKACVQRLTSQWPTIIPVHTPIHASWLNQKRDLLLDSPTQGPDPQ